MFPVAAILGAVERPDGMGDDDYEMLRRATATAALHIKMFMHNPGTAHAGNGSADSVGALILKWFH